MNVALRARSIDFISLCTGGGGLDLGIELAVPGARAVCMVEREAFAVAHLVAAMRQNALADAPVWSDARTFDGRRWRGCVDGVIGGIPCQPHSLAGRKRGSLDERDLWSDARRILVQSRAWFVLIENVGGMLSAGADEIAGAERVWRDLRKLGFAVEIGLFTAAEVGASHERERVFILGVADADERQSSFCGGLGFDACEELEAVAGVCRPVADAECDGWRQGIVRAGVQRRRAEPDKGGDEPLVHSERTQWWQDAVGARKPDGNDRGRDQAAGGTGEPSPPMVDSSVDGWREGGSEPDIRGWRYTTAGASERLEHAHGTRRQTTRTGPPLDTRQQFEQGCGLFPPGPGDRDAWAEIAQHAPHRLPALSRHDLFRLEIGKARAVADGDPRGGQGLDPQGPYGLRAEVVQEIAQSTLRGLADGLAATRIDWLRLLGNGVVHLQAAHAFHTLGHRLAARGSAGAARLVRMMGGEG